MKIYLVIGNNGDYDYEEWPVIACQEELKAKEIMKECEEEVTSLENDIHKVRMSHTKITKVILQYKNNAKWDKGIDRSVGYSIAEVELI